MRRAIILVTLTLLLFAVAGVTVATENSSSPQAGDQTESTAPESTEPEPAEATAPETTVREEVEEPDERTVEKPMAPEEPQQPGEEVPGAANHGVVGNGNGTGVSGEPAARPEHAQGGKQDRAMRETGKPGHPGGPPARIKPGHAGGTGGERVGGNPGKVTLCHKGRVTISVGTPAQPAHLRHGDTVGPC